ncbi:hypothetical protein [Pedobacter psychrophilus]|nr:hypothetical protein [Pedobacter psychrophilus]
MKRKKFKTQSFCLCLLALCFLLTTGMQCKKDKTDTPGLPTATQEGKNTLGFLLNGEAWTPKGLLGSSANLSIDVDLTYKKGVFNISAYNSTSYKPDVIYFGLGIKDSLNNQSIPVTYLLTNESLFGVYFSNDDCTLDYFNSSIKRSGSLTITKLDKVQRIISGTFDANLSLNGCSDVKITQGRFDMKY